MSNAELPPIQPIANLVVTNGAGQVLLAKYNPANEAAGDKPDAEQRWWLPAHELHAYQHPDEAAAQAIEDIGGLQVDSIALARVQSFRGRRGWHISFDYLVNASGDPAAAGVHAAWHTRDALPPTMHGNWERETIDAVLEA